MHMLVSAVKDDERQMKDRCHCTLLRKASRRVSKLYDLALAPTGLKITQHAILVQIRRAGAITVGKLAEALVMDAGALAHTLKPLERDGFVMTATDPLDRRSRLISLTPAGLEKLIETQVLIEKAQRSFETAIGGSETAALREALHLLISDGFEASFEKGLA